MLDGQKLSGVSRIAFSLDANTLVPTFLLSIVPGEIEIEMEGPADVHKAETDLKDGFAYDLFGAFRFLSPTPLVKPLAEREGMYPGLKAEWAAAFSPGDKAETTPEHISAFKLLDDMVKKGAHVDPIVLKTGPDGVVRPGTLEEFDNAAKGLTLVLPDEAEAVGAALADKARADC